MRKRHLIERQSALRFGNFAVSLVFGLAAFLALPTFAGHADLATFLAGTNRGGENWKFFLTSSSAGSIQTVDMGRFHE